MRRPLLWYSLLGLAIVGIALWAAKMGVSPGAGKVVAPRAVFLLVVDTLRADRLSSYGCASHATPNMDRLASLGVGFGNAQSPSSWTRPSMGAMMTSLYPTQLGLIERLAARGELFAARKRRKQLERRLTSRVRTLAEILGDAGFQTAAFVDQPALNKGYGWEQGFRDWYYPAGLGDIRHLEEGQSVVIQAWDSTEISDRIDRELIQVFDGWLADHARDRVFAWVHLLTPHLPYVPDPRFLGGRVAAELAPSESYDAEVQAVDEMVGSMLSSIEQHVGIDESLIVFTSDHGEEFQEHDGEEHGHSLHREVTHVPLIFAAPSIPKGLHVDEYVSTIDVLPTILCLLGLESVVPRHTEGSSLIPLIAGDESNKAIYAEGMLYGSTERSVISEGHKLMYDQQGLQYRLYSLDRDPGETEDVAGARPQRVATMRGLLKKWQARVRIDYEKRWSEPSPLDRTTQAVSDADTEALRVLGYLDD